MSIKHTHQLTSALISAPTTDSEYPTFLIGENTRNALLSLVRAVEDAAASLTAEEYGVAEEILEPYLYG